MLNLCKITQVLICLSAEPTFPMIHNVPISPNTSHSSGMGVNPLAWLTPSLTDLLRAMIVVGKCTSNELSRVQTPPYCGDMCSPVVSLITQRSKKAVQTACVKSREAWRYHMPLCLPRETDSQIECITW